MVWSTEGWLPLAKGAAEQGEAEGFAPTDMRSDFKNYCFQIILPLRLPLAKGAAEHSEAEGFAPTDMRSEF